MNRTFRFEPGDGFLHRLNPLAKLLCLILLSSGLMGAPWPLAVPLCAFCLASVPLTRIRLRDLVREGRFIAWMAAFILVLKCFDPEAKFFFRMDEALPAAAYSGKLCLLFVLAELFFKSTRISEIGSTASAVARRVLGRGDIDPGIYLSLAIDFLPRVLSAYGECAEAAGARGYGKARSPLSSTRKTIIAFMTVALKKALLTAEALESRSYRPDRSLEASKAGWADLSAVVACLSFFALSLVF